MSGLMARLIRCARTSVDEFKDPLRTTVQRIRLSSGYAQTFLKDTIRFWQQHRAVILNLPTGKGKTTFILEDVIPYAIKFNKPVLIVTNRITLNRAYKRKIAKMYKQFEWCPDDVLNTIDDFGLVKIINYQKLPKYLNDMEFCKSIGYLILDEAHYFTSDAPFSSNTGWLLRKIPEWFSQAVRIYMSATIDEVLPYICQAECTQRAEMNWHTYQWANDQYRQWLCWIEDKNFREAHPLTAEMLTSDSADIRLKPIPTLFEMKADYSHINLYFYSDDNVPMDIIQRSSHKSIYFVDNKRHGKQLAKELGDTDYMDADTIREDTSLMNNIINNEKFDAKTLIATSVFCNGCNILDKDVKHVFVESIDTVDILQMVGRRRWLSPDDTFDVYLRIPSIDMLESRIRNMQKILDIVVTAKTDNDKYLNLLLNGDYSVKNVSNIVFVKDGKLHFNQIAIDMLHTRIVYYKNLIDLLQAEGESGYCKKIAKELFNKEFTPEMIVSYHDYRAETIEWLDSFLNKTLSKEELNTFGTKLTDKIQLFNRDFKDRTDRQLGLRAINNRLQSNNLPYEVKQDNDSYIIVKAEIPS